MSMNPEDAMKKLTSITSGISNALKYDPQLLFTDTFDRIKQYLTQTEDLVSALIQDDPNYWIINNAVISLIPTAEHLIFCGYSDQILEFLLSLNQSLSSNLMFCTSRFIPLRLQLFSVICSAMANTQTPRAKDADLFVQQFRSDLKALMALEESNVNGLSEHIVTCDGKSVMLSDLFDAAFSEIELMGVHFSSGEEIEYEKVGSPRKVNKRKGGRVVKEEVVPQVIPPPPEHVVKLIINAFNAPLQKGEYNSRFSSVVQAWCNPECQLAPSLLHRLLFAFLKAGTIENFENLPPAFPDDPIVSLAAALAAENWQEVSDIMANLTKEQIAIDYQFFNEIAVKIWHRFANGVITDPLVLNGVLHVLVVSPSPCPMETSLVALQYCWHLDSLGKHEEAGKRSEEALAVLESFRDIFAFRKMTKVLPTTETIPNKSHDQSYLLFEKWLECLHTDLFYLWVRSKLKHGLEVDIEAAKVRFAEEIENTKRERAKTEELYGTLSIKQRQTFDQLINRSFKPPVHSKATEEQLLEQFKSNLAAKAIIFTQMSGFRVSKAEALLAKARDCLDQLNEQTLPVNSPLIYVNRYEIALLFPRNMEDARKVAVFGKETIGQTGLTTSNTALSGTGIKQDPIEPFIIGKLKPNTLYSFAFGAYDSRGDLIDNLTEPFSIATVHSLSCELIWSYMASAAYHRKDMETFDISLTWLLGRFVNVFHVPEYQEFTQFTNPFNKFQLKSSTMYEPSPMLRAFARALLMAARFFAAKPVHATSFQRIALLISQILKNHEMTLEICTEMFAILQPLLENAYHARWVIQPLLFIIEALKENKETSKEPQHQEILARCSFSLDSTLTTLYQERQLSLYVMQSVAELPPNPNRSAFLLFASRQQLLESNPGDQTLPLYAAELFRNAPERSYDDLFNKFKVDPMFPAAAVYLVAAAHNTEYSLHGANWSQQALEYIKTGLPSHETEEKPTKRANSRGGAKAQLKKKLSPMKGRNAQPKTPEEEAELAAAVKIQGLWNRFHTRRKNLAKFEAVNKYRAALNLLQAMCHLENDSQLSVASSQETGRTERRNTVKGRTLKTHRDLKKVIEDENSTASHPIAIVNALRRAIVLGDRSNDRITMQSAAGLMRMYLATLSSGTPAFSGLAQVMNSVVQVMIYYLPMDEDWSRKLLHDLLVFELQDNQLPNIARNLLTACQFSEKCGQFLWMLSGQDSLPEELRKIGAELQRRDPAENLYWFADDILEKVSPNLCAAFPDEPANQGTQVLVKAVNDIAVNLQHKQRLSMSICLLTRLSFALIEKKEYDLAFAKLAEALECHFRVVRAHEKVDQLLSDETEASFYEKHSWAGCVSIFVISTLLAMKLDRVKAMMLAKLASFAIAGLFSATDTNPRKQIDFADFEPPEIVPGVDLFADMDPNQPMLKPCNVEFVSIALTNLLSMMLSFELYFEMFKPIAFARHFYRYVVRERRGLARSRLFAVMICCQYGLIKPAIKVLNDVITCYANVKVTKEFALYPANAKKLSFTESEPAYSPNNQEAIRVITSGATIGAVTTNYGFSLTCQYAICVSRLLQSIAAASDPAAATGTQTAPVNRQLLSTARAKGKRPSHGKRDEISIAIPATSADDAYLNSLSQAEAIINEVLSKEFRPDQRQVKLELQIELCLLYMKQWRWEDAIAIASTVMKTELEPPTIMSSLIDRAMLTAAGLNYTAASVISNASYNLHDLKTADKYGTPYLKALILIEKAEYENAAQLLGQVAASQPITAFHMEYVLACAQLCSLYSANPKLVESAISKVPENDQERVQPLQLIETVCYEVTKFFVEELGLNNGKSLFIQNTDLLVRLRHLESLMQVTFNGQKDPMKLLSEARNIMTDNCPYVPHGLSFLLNAASSRIQMQSYLARNPKLIQSWNQEYNPLKSTGLDLSSGIIEKLTALLNTIFTDAPDCVVHPASQQSVLDLALLAGVGTSDLAKRVEQSLSILTIASAVRSAKRFIQSLIAQSPETVPTTCPTLLMNDNKDQKLRDIAAAYYSHVCSLDLPIFDTRISELRTLFFFRCFEEQCSSFKSIQTAGENLSLEAGQVVGQWYQVDAKLFRDSAADDISINDGITTVKSSYITQQTTRSSFTAVSTASSMAKRRAAILKGSLYFFMGIIVDVDETKRPKPVKGAGSSLAPVSSDAVRLTPVMLAAQLNDLVTTSNEMAEVGLGIEEAHRMENVEGGIELPIQQKDVDATARLKRKLKSTKSVEQVGTVSLLKNQAAETMRNAEAKWGISLHKAEHIFNKSNRIIGYLVEQKNKWPTVVKMTGIDITSATTLSHFFNPTYGINEKAPQLANWLDSSLASTEPHLEEQPLEVSESQTSQLPV